MTLHWGRIQAQFIHATSNSSSEKHRPWPESVFTLITSNYISSRVSQFKHPKAWQRLYFKSASYSLRFFRSLIDLLGCCQYMTYVQRCCYSASIIGCIQVWSLDLNVECLNMSVFLVWHPLVLLKVVGLCIICISYSFVLETVTYFEFINQLELFCKNTTT